MIRRVLRRSKGWLLALVVMLVMATTTASAQRIPERLTATQTVLLEATPHGPAVIATVVVDLALGPTWNWTYVHDAAWEPGRRWRSHDVSVTRYIGGAKDLSATVGVRVKAPAEEDQRETVGYVLFAWRFGR